MLYDIRGALGNSKTFLDLGKLGGKALLSVLITNAISSELLTGIVNSQMIVAVDRKK